MKAEEVVTMVTREEVAVGGTMTGMKMGEGEGDTQTAIGLGSETGGAGGTGDSEVGAAEAEAGSITAEGDMTFAIVWIVGMEVAVFTMMIRDPGTLGEGEGTAVGGVAARRTTSGRLAETCDAAIREAAAGLRPQWTRNGSKLQ